MSKLWDAINQQPRADQYLIRLLEQVPDLANGRTIPGSAALARIVKSEGKKFQLQK